MSRLLKLCCLIASTFVLLLATVPSVLAHAHPKLMKPVPDSTGPAPNEILIKFSEGIEPKFSFIRLTDDKGKSADSDVSKPAPGDPTTLILPVSRLAPGTYIVHWVNVSVDGHRLDGNYKFTVK